MRFAAAGQQRGQRFVHEDELNIERLPRPRRFGFQQARVGTNVVRLVATTPMRVPSRTASAIIASSILRTGIDVALRIVSTHGEMVEQVTSTTSAPIWRAASTWHASRAASSGANASRRRTRSIIGSSRM